MDPAKVAKIPDLYGINDLEYKSMDFFMDHISLKLFTFAKTLNCESIFNRFIHICVLPADDPASSGSRYA
jgi:hypothetical protein